MHYLKIINTFFRNNISILKQISGQLKNGGIKTSVDQVVLELMIKTIFTGFD